MPKFYLSQRIVLIFAVLALLCIGFYAYAWTDPGQPPPGGSVPALIDSGGVVQTKTGGLNVLGNVGVGAVSPNSALDVNGAIKANNHLTHLPWKNFADPPNGYIKLSTPIVHNESNMFSLRIFGYEYSNGSDPIEIQCVGYAYSATTLINTKCQTQGTDLAVEIGTETRPDQGGKTVVIIRIGTPTWDWYYPQLTAEYIGWKAKNEADFKWVTGETAPVQTGNTNNVVINDQTGNSWFNASGNVGIGTTSPKQKLEVSGGVRLNTSAAKPACDANLRGTIWFTQGGAGAKDAAEICAKDAAGAYAWRAVW